MAVNIDIFETEVFCAMLLRVVLRRPYKSNANADVIPFLFSECLLFWFAFSLFNNDPVCVNLFVIA